MNRPFLRHVVLVMSGTIGAQVVGILLMPIVTRLYEPAAFGVYGAFMAVVAVLAAGVTLQYSQALMLPRGDSEAAHLLVLSLVSTLAVSGACGVLVLLFPGAVSGLTRMPAGFVLALLPVAVFLNGQSQTLQAWRVRGRMFRRTAQCQMLRTLGSCLSQIGLGLLGAGPLGLAGGSAIGDLCAGVGLSLPVSAPRARFPRAKVRYAKLKALGWRYRDFPLYSASQNVLNAASQGLPILLLGHCYGLHVAGAYALAVRVLHVPMAVVLVALRQVLFQKAGELHRRREGLWPVFRRSTEGLVLLAIVPAVAGFLWSGPLFAAVFGDQWREAGRYAGWLVLWMAAAFCNTPAVLCARVIRKNQAMLVYEILSLCSRLGVLVLGGRVWSAGGTIIALSTMGMVVNLVLIGYVGHHIRQADERTATVVSLPEAGRMPADRLSLQP